MLTNIKSVLKGWRREKPQPRPAPPHTHEWSIGIYAGNSPCDLRTLETAVNPVLTGGHVTDRRALFVADPFMVQHGGEWHMFFEVWDSEINKGDIGWATSPDGLRWKYGKIVLSEPFHLSYPYVFQWQGDCYMVPETFEAGSVRLYKASRFPTRWTCVATLLNGPFYVDSSLFRYADTWWLISETNPAATYDTLRLFYAEELTGPWREHPQSPIVSGNPHRARPAGRVVTSGETIIRYAQDCYPTYGTQVHAFEIVELTTRAYRERPAKDGPVLAGGGTGWNAGGMHHIDPHQLADGRWRACVDGWRAPAEGQDG